MTTRMASTEWMTVRRMTRSMSLGSTKEEGLWNLVLTELRFLSPETWSRFRNLKTRSRFRNLETSLRHRGLNTQEGCRQILLLGWRCR